VSAPSVIAVDARFVSSTEDVVGEPTTAAALTVAADWARGSSATPATPTEAFEGAGSPRVPAYVIGRVAARRPSPAPSVG